MSKKTIELGTYDAAIVFHENGGIQFNICETLLNDDTVTGNIVLALTIFYLLLEDNKEFAEFINEEKQKQLKKLIKSQNNGEPNNTVH